MATTDLNITSAPPSELDNIAVKQEECSLQEETKEKHLRAQGLRFWLVFISMLISLFVSALELTAVSTALPTIANALHADQFIWVGSAYAIAASAFIPFSGGVAEIFGRRFALFSCMTFFFIGSTVCGAAKNMSAMIAGRTIQGLGSGGIQSVTMIILADLVSLQDRGLYASFFGLVWSIANFLGPIVGGALANKGNWRWLFYMNLPITGFAGVIALVFMRLPTPSGTLAKKLRKVDWIGSALIVGSTTSCAIALTWGGVTFPWSSGHVLAPLIIGVVGLLVSIVYETKFASNPLIPWAVVSNRTTVSGYVQTFIVGLVTLAVVYFIPVFLQACKDASPIRSGVITLGSASIAPSAAIASILVRRTGGYRPQIYFGWVLSVIGLGLLTLIDADTTVAKVVGFLVFLGLGLGAIYSTTVFPIQAPLPVTMNAPSLALLIFCRSFAQIWGLTIGSTVLQNELTKRLASSPSLAAFLSQFPQGIAVAYSIIPEIKTLAEPLKTEARNAFAESLKVLWQTLIGIAGIGVVSLVGMRAIQLHTVTDVKWAMDKPEGGENSDMEEKDKGGRASEEVRTVPPV